MTVRDQHRRLLRCRPGGIQGEHPVPPSVHPDPRPQWDVPMRRMRLPSRVHGDERGATAVIVVLTLIALCGVIVLTVDVGQLLFKRRAMVNASDSAALSAAQTCAGINDSDSPEAMADAFAVDNVSTVNSVPPTSPTSSAVTARPSATSPSSTRCSRGCSSRGCWASMARRPCGPKPQPAGDPRAAPTRCRSWSTRGTIKGTATSRRASARMSPATSGSTTISSTVRRSGS